MHGKESDNHFTVDISDFDALKAAFAKAQPIDYIIHLAGNPNADASWEDVLKNNIVGTRNIYACARKFGVKKIVLASSTHLVGAYEGYPTKSPFERPITPLDEPRPDSYYGVSKGFGELLAREYYDLYGIESICIRIGSLGDTDQPDSPYEKLWLSYADAAQVFEKALLADVPFGIYFATSDNGDGIYDIATTKKDLGFNPIDGTRRT